MCPQWFVGRSPDRVCEGVRGSASIWYVPNPGCYSPSSSLPLSHAAHLSILDGIRKKWASLTASHTAGEAGCSLACSNFPLWVRSQTKGGGLSWHWTVMPWGKGDASKVKLFILLFSTHPILAFFFFFPLQQCARISLLNSQTFTKVLLLWVIVKIKF